MRPETLDLLCNPYKGEPFIQRGETLVGAASGQAYRIRDGIPVILSPEVLAGRSRWSKLIYDLTAFAYDPIVSLGDRIKFNSEQRVRESVIAGFDLPSKPRILETAAGTASNFFHLPKDCNYFGLDVSFPMLKRAQRKIHWAGRVAELFQAEAAYVPFRDDTFDLVFQMGGLQFLSDPFRAVSEMARVSKPGAFIHVIDELRGAIQTLAQMPAHRKYADNPEHAVEGIQRLVPHSMEAVSSRIIPNTDFYQLTFRKPAHLSMKMSIRGERN
jgi:ubiquinone/menaquinone biosynthesis C-methylase UbiE/uncharacterized protein YbaR (Trm112 family)